VPVWLVELHVNAWAEHPVIALQVAPPSAEYSKSTVPVGGVLSDPGGVTETVAV
jgi:hypothetical protein